MRLEREESKERIKKKLRTEAGHADVKEKVQPAEKDTEEQKLSRRYMW